MKQAPDSHCLLCNSGTLSVIEMITTDLVTENYNKAFGVDVSSYFRSISTLSLIECVNCGLRYFDPLVPGDAAFYEALQRLPWYYQDIKPEYHFAKTQIGANERVLEVGCGKGVFRSFLPANVDYLGLEFNQVAIDKATAQGLHVTAEPIQQHADAHPGEYDVVCHFQVLEHVTDPQGFLSACAKAVKPGGKLIVAVPAEDSFLSINRNDWLNMPPHHVSRWRDKTLRHSFENELGFIVKELWHEPVADYHKDWHHGILARHGLKELTRGRVELGGTDRMSRLASFAVGKLHLRNALYRYGVEHFEYAERGHTVCVVGTRPQP